MEALALWHWAHNVRELENLLLKLSVFSRKASVLDRAFLEREAPQMLERLERPTRQAKPGAVPPSSNGRIVGSFHEQWPGTRTTWQRSPKSSVRRERRCIAG
jgi:DNA-binding NtrC family response regulator